jgi:hypothetical protein
MGLIYCICESLVQDLTLWNRIGVERTARGADMTIVASDRCREFSLAEHDYGKACLSYIYRSWVH